MQTNISFTRKAYAAVLLALVLVGLLGGQTALAQGPIPSTACTGTGTVTCELWAKPGTLALPGSVTVTVWGYADSAAGAAQVPGPALIVNQGESVTVILHNDLPVATSLRFEGQGLRSDLSGVAAGGTTSYVFTANQPGIFLYEAGPVPGTQYQAAMGLYGALIIRPATAGQAYNNVGSAYEGEALVVLSEIDPALNNSAAPATFDMRQFKPKYFLINGKAYPQTDPIGTLAGNRVLLRYVNAGQQTHTMSILGMQQTFLSLAGVELPAYRKGASQLLMPGQSADAIATVPPATAAPAKFALSEAGMLLHNTGSQAFGGMLTFLDISGTPGTDDTLGPTASNLVLDPPRTNGGADVTLTAIISDAASTILQAEFYIGSTAGTAHPMTALDGAFDGPTETVQGTISVAEMGALTGGTYSIYVRGQDNASIPNWGAFNFITLNLDKTGPTTSGIALTPAVSNGSVSIAIQATGNDSASGGGIITAAEFFIDVVGANGDGTAMTVNAPAPIASLTGTIPSGLSAGAHTLSVHSQDDLGNWGALTQLAFTIDQTGPVASLVNVYPDPNNGTLGVNPVTPSVRVDVSLTDAAANVAAAEGFIDRADLAGDQDPGPGNGFPFTPLDGIFNSGSEGAYAFIPLTTINALPAGTHTIRVRGRDAAGNWGTTASDTLTIDKIRPTVTQPTASPNPTNGAASITLTSSASDVATGNSNIARAEWFRSPDPGAGNGTAMSASDGAFNSSSESLTATIDVRGWPEGNNIVSVRARDAAGNWSLPASITVNVTRLLYFSTFGNTNPPGVGGTADDADIYFRNATTFSRAIDATALGLPTGANVDGLVWVDSTHFYLSFSAANTSVPGIGNVQDEDVVYYNNGVWSVYFDGTAAGLTAANQDLDAFDIVGGVLYFSTVGNTNPPGVAGTADDADIYAWDGTTFSRVFVATAAGLPAGANVDGFVRVDATHFFLSFSGLTTAVPGIGNVQDEDVVYNNAGIWSVYFDGTAKGLTADNQDIDAFDVP